MKITIGNSKQIIDRSELENGEIFYYEGEYYMAICTTDYGFIYDSINLSNGKPVYIGDEEVYCIEYEFIIK